MTQGFPAQPQYGQMPPQQYPPQGYAPPAQPQYTQPVPVPQGYPRTNIREFFQTQDPHIRAEQGPAAVSPPPMTSTGAAQQTDTTGFWGGAPSLSFDAQKGYVKGTFRGGKVLSKTISNQTDMANGQVRTWDDGSPRKQMVLLLQTSERADPQDNGQRQLFIKGDLPRACREAFQGAGASDIEIGSWVYAAWIDDKPAKKAGFNPSKIYKIVYARPGQPDPTAGQPAYQPNPAPAPANQVPVPQPGQGADQFAEYAAYQQQLAAHQAAAPPAGVPQFTAPAPGPISNMPAQQAATMNGMWQAAQQMEPQTLGQPEQPQQFAAPQPMAFTQAAIPEVAQIGADQAAQFAAWQAAQQPQPGGQPSAPGYPPSPQQTAPQGQQPQPWSPFA